MEKTDDRAQGDKKLLDEIKKLKKQLQSVKGKYLKKRKKEIKDPKKYKKTKEALDKRVGKAKNLSEIQKLIELLTKGVGAPKPAGSSAPITQQIPSTQGTIASRVRGGGGQTRDVLKDWRKLRDSWTNIKDKYDNDTIDLQDITNIYNNAKNFATGVNENLPSKEQLIALYGTGKRMYNYLKRFINNNRPSTENPVSTEQPATQTPPPTPPPSEPTPPPSDPTPPPSAPTPRPPPVVDGGSGTQTWGEYLMENAPNPVNTGMGIGLLAGGGLLGRNLNRLRNRQVNNDLVMREQVVERAGAAAVNAAAEGIGGLMTQPENDDEWRERIKNIAEQSMKDIRLKRQTQRTAQSNFRERDAETLSRGDYAQKTLDQERRNPTEQTNRFDNRKVRPVGKTEMDSMSPDNIIEGRKQRKAKLKAEEKIDENIAEEIFGELQDELDNLPDLSQNIQNVNENEINM